MTKLLYIFLLLISIPALAFRIDKGVPTGSNPSGGYIDIAVESNVNVVNFTYALNSNSIDEVCTPSSGAIVSGTTDFVVPVKDFRCTNDVAYQDFLKLLKADQYPDLTISIPQNILSQVRAGKPAVLHNVLINIAGVSKKYDIICSVENSADNDILLVGEINIRLTELEIDPPVKYFGLIKIKDEVIVKFGFSLTDNSLALKKD